MSHLEFSSYLLVKEDWKKVAQKLVSLEVVVPAIYYNANYDLPTKDAKLLLTSCVQLTCLTLKGAGILEHIDLSTIEELRPKILHG